MRKYLVRSGLSATLLSVITTVFVVSFQGYWLVSDYRQRKSHLLRQVETAMRERITHINLGQLYALINIRKDDTAYQLHIQEIMRAASRKPDSIVLDDTARAATRAVSIELRSGQKALTDSAILTDLHEYLLSPEITSLQGATVSIIHYRTVDTTYFPRTLRSWPESNNTGIVPSDFNPFSSYQVHIHGLPLVILAGMSVPILLSLVYLSLFVLTLLALLKVIKRNRKLVVMRNNFTRNITHELNIPITTLLIATEALDKFNGLDDKQEARKYIGFLYRGIAHISQLVDTILNAARAQFQSVQLNLELLSVKSLLQEVLERLSLQIAGRKAAIRIVPADTDALILADRLHLSQVFQNIIDNSIKYCRRVPEITINVEAGPEQTTVVFRDNGIGIPAAYLKDVFQPYFRAPEEDLHTVKGYGLGLSYVESMISLHGGNIRIVSSGPGGTVISITLPNKHVEA